jgi:5'(3')-deoxyribonucleotidase
MRRFLAYITDAYSPDDPQLFIDLDGVLADFDDSYVRQFGGTTDRSGPVPKDFWKNIASDKNFYRNLPPMPDAQVLWKGACKLHPKPVILSGIPPEIPDACNQKHAWVKQHISQSAKVICCLSKDKYLHGKPGDVLVDDWLRYKSIWEQMGGIFVLHTSAKTSLAAIKDALSSRH